MQIHGKTVLLMPKKKVNQLQLYSDTMSIDQPINQMFKS